MLTVKKTGDLRIKERLKLVEKLFSSVIIDTLTDEAFDQFNKSFPKTKSDAGGRQTDSSSSGWIKRKDNTKNTVINKTGALKNSIKKSKKGRYGIIYTDLDYASYHNNGTGRLPQREFIGKSKKLVLKSKKIIKLYLNNIFKSNLPKIF